MTTTAALLLLADSRLPAGAHAHSGGIEQAVSTGRVRDVTDLAQFLAGRLSTAGVQAAAVAAHAHRLTEGSADAATWVRLDAEVSARIPSPAQRRASRALGRALLRVVGRGWPVPMLTLLGDRPHAAVVQGVAVALVGGTAHDAALLAANAAVTGPATAALRLLGLDPVEVTRLLADLASEVDSVAGIAVTASAVEDPRDLPSPSLPLLDVLAEQHARSEVKLFAS